MDVGGTHTRVRILESSDEFETRPSVIATRTTAISGIQAFVDFTRKFIAEAGAVNTLDLAVVCLAGPVIGRTVAMINWIPPADLDLTGLVPGLPEDRIILMNDMEAAGYGLIAYKLGAVHADCVTLHAGTKRGTLPQGNSVLLMPGTGIGVAGLILDGTALELAIPVPCEVQHTPIAPLDPQHTKIAQQLAGKLGKPRVSWEDFISGQGLVNIYNCLRETNRHTTDQGLTAAAIAERAVQATDPLCTEALNLYYRCTGALAQLLALTFQAYGGIYLAGNSTRTNISFIQNSPFLAELHNNGVRGDLLKLFPVYLLPIDLNLEGACFAASKYYKK